MKKLLILLAIMSLVLVACAGNNNESMNNNMNNKEMNEEKDMNDNQEMNDNKDMDEEKVVMDEGLEMTLEELKQYNGKDGNKAYVAVDGIIYDMTDSSFWKNGGHNGFEAGQDLTDAIMNESPHGVKMLDRVPVVGKLIEDDEMSEDKMDGELELTLEELKQYNGKDGNKAYVAVDGIIYDMTDSSFWKNGGHNGFEAGQDLTDAIMNKSPHGVKMLDRVPIVGKIVE